MKLSWNILIFCISIISLNCFAIELRTKISKIDISDKAQEPSLIFLSNGKVVKVHSANTDLLRQLQTALEEQAFIKFTTSDDRVVTKVERIHPPMRDIIRSVELKYHLPSDEKITVLNSMKEANDLFKYARLKNKESQCFNRAHVWSYEWKVDKNINSAKMFIFFSVKYIREHNFHWWFHVAPYVHVVVGNEIKERIIDKKYMHGPSTLRQWMDRFMEDGAKCRTVKRFSEYANFPEATNCYLMRSSMYTYWPLDLEMHELKGITKNYWVPDELGQAYLDAYDIKVQGIKLP